jgi:hypothetical protein
MSQKLENLTGLPKILVDYINAQSQYNGDLVSVIVERANVTATATASAWSYSVPFRLVGSSTGETIAYTGTIGAAATDTSSAGTASVSSATPTVTRGHGTVTLSGDAQSWLAADTATCTLTYTNLRGGTATKTFVVTFA